MSSTKKTCQVVRDSFPLLLGTTIASSYGVEDVTPMHLADMSTTETTITTTKSTTKALAVGADDHDSVDVVVLESRTREKQKEKEVDMCTTMSYDVLCFNASHAY
jgi:hypothetical protein